MPSDSRAHALRIKQIAELVPRRMEEVQRNSSLKLHTQKSLGEAIGWSPSTIREDIKDMVALGYPIKFDTRRNGYVFTEKFSGIPTAFITESDMAKLCLAIRALESLKGTPLFRLIQKALNKLVRALTDKFGVDLRSPQIHRHLP
jgi:predicted DNA-binding transcriptional regulator YafY